MCHCLSLWRRWCALGLLAVAVAAHGVPPGYRYVGSRVVTGGRVVYWYWNADILERAVDNRSFVARMYARAVDVGQERPYVAEVRCDTRTYREFGAQGPYQPIEDGEPVAAIWRAGCEGGRALALAERSARLGNATPSAPGAPPTAPSSAPVTGAPAVTPPPALAAAPRPGSASAAPAGSGTLPGSVPAGATKDDVSDPRRADTCIRFAETRGSAAGEATIGNTCAFPVEVTLCYKGGRGGPYDCPPAVRGRRSDSLPPGTTHVLPDYRRGTHKGVALVACRGAMGTVFPRLDESGGRCS